MVEPCPLDGCVLHSGTVGSRFNPWISEVPFCFVGRAVSWSGCNGRIKFNSTIAGRKLALVGLNTRCVSASGCLAPNLVCRLLLVNVHSCLRRGFKSMKGAVH